MLGAAAVEVNDSYSASGNDFWTYEACKTWWRNRDQLVSALLDPELGCMNHG
ncbi:hypothetical protein [Hymenobacter chitinivorans]|uniref:hypothetical protein n=1 Tax=Hymenobacter chitinivorans TaxID=89969 RepID=UPI0012FD6022|nr:hypothetical protein [Hymenobacter chitinivorans]